MKQGLQYYTVDTDRYQDRRIKRLKKAMGCPGLAVYDYLLCEIYRGRGCFLEWDEDTAFDAAEYLGLKESLVREIVKYCGAVGLYDRGLLSRGIITSASIQKRYLAMCARAKRQVVEIPECCRIREETPKLPEESEKLPEETAIPPEVDTQSKVIESEIKENNSLSVSLSLAESENERSGVTTKERELFFKILFLEKNVKNASAEVDRFINHYAANGWCRKDGTPIRDKTALCRTWRPQEQGGNIHPTFIEWWRKVYEASPRMELLNGLRKVEFLSDDDRWCFGIHITAEALDIAKQTGIKAPFEVKVKRV